MQKQRNSYQINTKGVEKFREITYAQTFLIYRLSKCFLFKIEFYLYIFFIFK